MRWRNRRPEGRPDAPVYRHGPQKREGEALAAPCLERREALETHLSDYLGDDWLVLSEVVSDLIRLDVYVWAPTPRRPAYTLVTFGMSDLPMSIPADLAAGGMSPYAELMISLPPLWPMPSGPEDTTTWADHNNYFPVRALKALGRLPHQYDTWLGIGHTIPNGDPPEPLCQGTQLVSWILLPPITLPPEFSTAPTPAGEIELLALVAITNDEQDLKLEQDMEALLPGFQAQGISDVLDIGRSSSLGPPPLRT